MGTFSIRIEIGDSNGQNFKPVDALVDMGATNTTIPASMLRDLGITPYTKANFQIADGRRLELDIGRAWVRVDGKQEFTQVVFGTEGSGPILGAVTLEEMGLSVDPVAHRLVPVDRYLM